MVEENMSALQCLRALISNNNQWEYCVIWKLGDDPSRFIEWGSCFCSGGNIKIKDENDDLIGECKDDFVKHRIRSKACKKLAQLPSVIPLYSGIHGDVVISKQPRWTTSDSELNGTQVLVPVSWGLIELFSTKHVSKDQKLIQYISALFKVSLKQENMTENMLFPSLHHYINVLPQPNNYSSFEGSDHQNSRNLGLKRKRNTEFALGHENEKVDVKNSRQKKARKGPYTSKNLETERNRRRRIKDGMFALRALVPKITKMDITATLGDAADYIKELEETIQNYQNELRTMEDEECDKLTAKDMTMLIKDSSADKKNGATQKTPLEVQVEVSQLGTKDFLLKLICNQTRGGFSRLMEAIESLGLQVTDANVTTLNGSTLNLLKLKAYRSQVDPNALKSSLIQLVK